MPSPRRSGTTTGPAAGAADPRQRPISLSGRACERACAHDFCPMTVILWSVPLILWLGSSGSAPRIFRASESVAPRATPSRWQTHARAPHLRQASPARALEIQQHSSHSAIVLDRAEAEFGEDVADVLAHCGIGECESARDINVRPAIRHECQHLSFARSEAVERSRCRRPR